MKLRFAYDCTLVAKVPATPIYAPFAVLFQCHVVHGETSDNRIVGDPNILQEFTDFYKRVGQPNTVGADDRYVNQIADYLQSDKNHSARVSPIDLAVIDDAVRDLPLRIAPGHDGIQNEHIIYAGPQLLVHLSLLFTAMLRHSYVPEDFRLGIIKPILKFKHGDSTSLDMYQGITLTPSLSKLFDSANLEGYL